MKKIVTLLLSVCTILCLGIALVGCAGGNDDKCKNGHIDGHFLDMVSPTCEEGGYMVYHCDACDEDYSIPDGSVALGHYVYNYTYDNNHTCTSNGTESGVCQRCGELDSKEVPTSAKHEWNNSIFCKHCKTEPYVTRNLQFTLNQDQTGYIVSWKTYSADEVVSMLQDGTAYTTSEKIINIPSTYKNLPVVEVAANGFNGELVKDYSNMPNWESTLQAAGYDDWGYFTNIWNYHNSLHGIEYVYIPSSVKIINDNAFYRMKVYAGEKSVIELNEGLEKIGNNAFSDCGASGSIVLPSTLTALGEGAFSSCQFLEEVTFNCDKLTTIPSNAFSSTGLRKLTIPSFVNNIQPYAFDCYKLLTIIIESDNLTVENNGFGFAAVNTIINKSNHDYTLDEVSNWFYYTQNDLAFREEDPNKAITLTCLVQDNKYENGVHVGVDNFERDVTFYYSHLNGENILTDIIKPSGVLKELSIPEGITLILENLLHDIQCDKVTLPSSLKTVGYAYGFSPKNLIVSEYTDLSSLNIDTSRTTITLTESENMVSINLYDIWNSLNSNNEFSYTQEGVTFKFSVPGKSEMSIDEGTVFPNSNPHVWFMNSGLRVDIALSDGDERHAIYLGILGNNASGSINDGVQVSAYYFDAENNEYKKIATSYQFDVDPDEFSWVENQIEGDYGNGNWYFELNNIVDYGYKVKSIYIKFAQDYNADLTKN